MGEFTYNEVYARRTMQRSTVDAQTLRKSTGLEIVIISENVELYLLEIKNLIN